MADRDCLRGVEKDELEAKAPITEFEALTTLGGSGRSKIDGRGGGGFLFSDTEDLISYSKRDSSIDNILDINSPVCNTSTVPVSSAFASETWVGLESSNARKMQVKGTSSDVLRVSVSSAPSTSSHGSAQDDCDALDDVYIWGEIICDNSLRIATDSDFSFSSGRTDILLPKPLESNLVLDVHHVACGVRHAALVTKQGEVFTWGEESGGRVGHGVGVDVIHPRLLESFAVYPAEFVASGEFHTCAITMAGELYSWGDGTISVGLLGHGTDVSHWIPKRVSGPLDGLQVTYVTCGTWHTALLTSAGQLFTFGDGSFGVLGHGDKASVSQPREVESLMGLRTISVACGVWHTAAVVEVIVSQSSASSGKLFTWGDGDKYRLGHGDKEPRLKPTCVASLIDHNFQKLACGHSLTVGLTTSGQVLTMGSTVYGQLGNPQSDGKVPCLVEDKLKGESVVEVACGSYHVAVLTNRNEVYTWGKGGNGRLGHGDLEDRKSPILVEALKDRAVKRIACGANFTTAICQHKWVLGPEQSQCSGCRQPFGFTRKRHNCYHCGLVHCNSCSSRKAFRAALAPNPRKPYRVCDSCYVKLNNVLEAGGTTKKNGLTRLSGESKDKLEKTDTKSLKTILPGNLDLMKNLDIKASKYVKKNISSSLMKVPKVNSLSQLKDVSFAAGFDLHGAAPRGVRTSMIHSLNPSRTVSPFSRKASPPRSATPIPTTSGLSLSKSNTDSLKKTNELLNQEIKTLHAQIESMTKCCELQEHELQNSSKKVQEAMALVAEESAKSKAAKEVIKSLTAQLKNMAERLPQGIYENHGIRPVRIPNGVDSLAIHQLDLNGKDQTRSNGNSVAATQIPVIMDSPVNGNSGLRSLPNDTNKYNSDLNSHRAPNPIDREEEFRTGKHGLNTELLQSSSRSGCDSNKSEHSRNSENILRSHITCNQDDVEWIEQYEPGVYLTLKAFRDGTRDLKRVRFSRRRFVEQQAEAWWFKNREKVYEKYNICGSDRASSATSTQSSHRTEDA